MKMKVIMIVDGLRIVQDYDYTTGKFLSVTKNKEGEMLCPLTDIYRHSEWEEIFRRNIKYGAVVESETVY